MTGIWKVRLLIATILVVAWATSAEACHRRRARVAGTYGYGYASPTGYYATPQGYATQQSYSAAYYPGGGYPGGPAVYPGGPAVYPGGPAVYPGGSAGYPGTYGRYDFGRPGYNP